MRIPPGDAGCRTKRSKTKTITRQGKRSTNPSGIEIDELPFSRILRLKKANLETLRPFSRDESSRGRLGEEGSHFEMRCFKPIGASIQGVAVPRGVERTLGGGGFKIRPTRSGTIPRRYDSLGPGASKPNGRLEGNWVSGGHASSDGEQDRPSCIQPRDASNM